MRIELLTIAGCPNAGETLALLREALALESVDTSVSVVEVLSAQHARSLRFCGSPSVRIDGRDIEPRPDPEQWGMTCRIYHHGAQSSGTPSLKELRAAIRRAPRSAR